MAQAMRALRFRDPIGRDQDSHRVNYRSAKALSTPGLGQIKRFSKRVAARALPLIGWCIGISPEGTTKHPAESTDVWGRRPMDGSLPALLPCELWLFRP